MSINITRNSESTITPVEKIIPKQPRDEKGRFTSGEFKLEKLTNEKVNSINDSMKSSPINMGQIEINAPFVANFLEDNGLIREEVDCGHIFHAMCLVAYEDSYYLFCRKRDKFGFHLNCGNLEEVLDTKGVNSLFKSFTPLDWETIQKA